MLRACEESTDRSTNGGTGRFPGERCDDCISYFSAGPKSAVDGSGVEERVLARLGLASGMDRVVDLRGSSGAETRERSLSFFHTGAILSWEFLLSEETDTFVMF